MEATGNFSNDSLQGEWAWYRENGILATKENYLNNKLVALQCFDEQGNYTGDYCFILKPPVPLGDYSDFENYMLDNIILPKELSDKRLEGTVTITCTITKDGKLSEINIEGCSYESLKKEIEKFFFSIREWSPAIIHNRPADHSFQNILPLSSPSLQYAGGLYHSLVIGMTSLFMMIQLSGISKDVIPKHGGRNHFNCCFFASLIAKKTVLNTIAALKYPTQL